MLLTLQGTAGIISLIMSILIGLVVVYLIITAKANEDKYAAKNKVYKVRGRYLAGLSGALLILLFITLQSLPYEQYQDKADVEVTVAGYQWSWRIAEGDYNGDLAQFTGTNEITLPVNKNIKFAVKSNDVNHNFAVYDDDGLIVTQTQAMPGYTNSIHHVFKKKGDYKVLCLEYCGVAHAFMFATIHVI